MLSILPLLNLFRGITSFGGSDMALCGIQGDIRLSPDGGATWNLGQQVNLNDPNLYSIASDGANTLVCGGDNNTLEVSTNGGANWTYQTGFNLKLSTSVGSTNFYSVTYSPGTRLFIATGTNGLVLMASNNTSSASWTWTGTNFGTSTLNGASSASTGPLQGITMLAGNSGTIILGCTPPQAPANTFGNHITNTVTLMNQTNALIGTTNSANVIIDSMHPSNSIALDWYPVPSGGTSLAVNSFGYQPTNALCGTYTNWVQARDLRTGFVSTNRTPFTFKIIPAAPTNASPEMTNVLGSSGPPIWVEILTNPNNPPSNFEVYWYTNAAGSAGFLSTGTGIHNGNQFFYAPTNTDTACGIYTNWAETVATNTSPEGVPVVNTNRIAATYVVIPAAPIFATNATNCALDGLFGMCPNPSISVSVSNNYAADLSGSFAVNWYNSSGVQVASVHPSGPNYIATYAPTDSIPGIHYYYAETTNAGTTFVSTNTTQVVFQVNPLPQWNNGPVFFTNTLTEPFQTNLNMMAPAINNLSTITSFSPGATVVVDWYTNPDPNIANFENPGALAYGGVSNSSASWGLPNGVTPGIGTNSFIPTNRICGSYTYYARARVMDPNFAGCACQSTNLIPVTFVLVPPAPTNAITDITNVLSGSTQVNSPIWVDILDNTDNPAANFVVNWYTNATGSNSANFLGTGTRIGNRFFYTPTNAACGIYTDWAETVATVTSPAGFPAVSTNRTPVVFAIIPAVPTLVAPSVQTNCAGTLNPQFSVIVTNGQSAYWYATNSSVRLANNTLFNPPPNATPGVWMFSAQAVDPVSGLTSTNTATVTLILEACDNPPTISMNPTNGIGQIQWEGDLTLLSTTNLAPPVMWTSVSTGSMSVPTNTFTWTNTSPPMQFFRLTTN